MPQVGQDWTGTILGNSYQLDQILGRGGMGAVYAARHLRTGHRVAVKLLHAEAAADAGIYRRFQDEARVTSRLKHPNIIDIIDFAKHSDGTPYIVMEFLAGRDLASYLQEHGALSLSDAIHLAEQVADALQAAHDAGVVHRDVKPQNIFLVHRPGSSIGDVKVVDFGISKIRDRTNQLTRTDTILGTPQYMSPEAALSQNSQLDGRSDQFSLAVVLYQVLSGQLPFQASNMVGVMYQIVHAEPAPLGQLMPSLPPQVAAAVHRGLAKNKEDRFPSLREFLAALRGTSISAVAAPMTASTIMAVGGTTISSTLGQRIAIRPALASHRALLGLGALGAVAVAAWLARSTHRLPPEPEHPMAALVAAPAPTTQAPDAGIVSRPVMPSPIAAQPPQTLQPAHPPRPTRLRQPPRVRPSVPKGPDIRSDI